ncbi:hypothetical protein K432DRAFT_385922 [Lepidopterella palustris CBS 459.81]|uniref:Uncharacterized protein n=1 Tax=Lepidopterella palustris CBS 459.81 TaxID=1314670 RepID=A0A8E2JB25_9PEZI|nr:hypothetical protein K432DRAFT_385922 [Lepidopterella palustris CBS 459.81]
MGPLARGISNIIGLGTEAYAHCQHSKPPSGANDNDAPAPSSSSHREFLYDAPPDGKSSDQLSPPYAGGRERSNSSGSDFSDKSDLTDLDNDEDNWARDETQDQLEGHAPLAEEVPRSVDALVDDFLSRHAPPTYSPSTPLVPLPYPVIIPQKRPESKTHGFIRAYAPDLAASGISQSTFLDFLSAFTTSIKGSRYFNTANLAIAASVISYTAAATPNVIVQVAAAIVHTSIEGGRRLHQTTQVNKFLDRMNEELFKPHGLYALLMTYDPKSAADGEIFDMDSNIATSIAKRDVLPRSKMQKFHAASGKTMGEAQLPEAAQLIFPALDTATEEQKLNAFKSTTAFIKDYGDRKAQAQFAANHPESKLNVGAVPEFSSRFADPNHPVQQGGILNLLSGGNLKAFMDSSRSQRRSERGYDNVRDRLGDRRDARRNKNKVGLGKSSKKGLKRVIAEVS